MQDTRPTYCTLPRLRPTVHYSRHFSQFSASFAKFRAGLGQKLALVLAYAIGFWLARLSTSGGGAAQ